MARVDLSVPYEEKDAAKSLGAKWDTATKLWYVPEGLDPSPFKQWLPVLKDPTPNVRCNRFYVASGFQNCGKCSAPVRMVAFVLPRGWEIWGTPDEDMEEHWQIQEWDTIIDYVGYLNDAAINAARKITPHYKARLKSGYQRYLNHCEKCGVGQQEPNSGNTHVFKPDTIEKAKALTLHYHTQPFECQSLHQSSLDAHGGYNTFEFMKQELGEC